MDSEKPFASLWQFHETYDCARQTTPGLPDAKTRRLRRRLLQEEFKEYRKAERNDDLVEIADALADIIYIAYGTAVAYGIPMDEVFAEVHASNMSKLDPETGKPIYRDDGKVLKGRAYFKADIAGILARTQDSRPNGHADKPLRPEDYIPYQT